MIENGIFLLRNLLAENTVTPVPALDGYEKAFDNMPYSYVTLQADITQGFSISGLGFDFNCLVIDCIDADDNARVRVIWNSGVVPDVGDDGTSKWQYLKKGANCFLWNLTDGSMTGNTEAYVEIKPSRNLRVRHLWLGYAFSLSRQNNAPFDNEALKINFNDYRGRNQHLQNRDMKKIQKVLSLQYESIRSSPAVAAIQTCFLAGLPFYFFAFPIYAIDNAGSDNVLANTLFSGYRYYFTQSGFSIPFIRGVHISLDIAAAGDYFQERLGEVLQTPVQVSSLLSTPLGGGIFEIQWEHPSHVPSDADFYFGTCTLGEIGSSAFNSFIFGGSRAQYVGKTVKFANHSKIYNITGYTGIDDLLIVSPNLEIDVTGIDFTIYLDVTSKPDGYIVLSKAGAVTALYPIENSFYSDESYGQILGDAQATAVVYSGPGNKVQVTVASTKVFKVFPYIKTKNRIKYQTVGTSNEITVSP